MDDITENKKETKMAEDADVFGDVTNEVKAEDIVQEVQDEVKKGSKELFYDKVHITLATLDLIIKFLFFALAAALILGIIAGRG
ncbi:MAG: hypothetical protein RR115_04895 [Hydrogenoanaerobacterium sp.]